MWLTNSPAVMIVQDKKYFQFIHYLFLKTCNYKSLVFENKINLKRHSKQVNDYLKTNIIIIN